MKQPSFPARALAHLKKEWRTFRRLRAGRRFQIHYAREQRKNRDRPLVLRVLRIALIPLFAAVGVLLTVMPGPAIVFFLLAAGLLAAQSLSVARVLDQLELKLRAAWATFRTWRTRHHTSPQSVSR
jgi:hypothetical protein